MAIFFRTDASLEIGTGHAMRCLTLAEALRDRGADCFFICREHPGNLISLICQRGFEVYALPLTKCSSSDKYKISVPYSSWLGNEWETDAQQTMAVIGNTPVDWLIVDHYAIDARWERTLRTTCLRLMVIDDLADRPHDCDLLLDQNLGRKSSDYSGLVPQSCQTLIGPQYALLRPEFAELRPYSLARRMFPQLRRLLIAMGGVDKDNATGKVLEALKGCSLPEEFCIKVVMGPYAPWLRQVRDQASQLPWNTEVLVNVRGMAGLMADSDLAIGAAGTTAWERCCLGLPTLTLVLAENQRGVATSLESSGSISLIKAAGDLKHDLKNAIRQCLLPGHLIAMQHACCSITDGLGIVRFLSILMNFDDGDRRIRAMTINDLDLVRAWRNHPKIRRYMLTQHEISIDEHRKWFERSSHDLSKRLLIFEEKHAPLGFVQFSGVTPGGIADWGFYTAPDSPKGTGKKLGRAALKFAFHTLGLLKVCGQALASNDASIHFHRELGFKQEAVLRKQHQINGNYQDLICFGLLCSGWSEIE